MLALALVFGGDRYGSRGWCWEGCIILSMKWDYESRIGTLGQGEMCAN